MQQFGHMLETHTFMIIPTLQMKKSPILLHIYPLLKHTALLTLLLPDQSTDDHSVSRGKASFIFSPQ